MKTITRLETKTDRWSKWTLLFLVLITWAVYGQTVQHEFVQWDDGGYVYENAQVIKGLEPGSILWAFSTTQMGLWHPLTWLSHMTDVELFGLNPAGHHLMNLLIHTLSGCLLFVILLRMTGELWRSAFVTALFLLHPLNVESVAWVAERKNVLSAFFWMLTIWSYLNYTDRPGVLRYAAMALFLALGLLIKPILVTLPCVLLLLDIWPLRRWPIFSGTRIPWPLFMEKLPLLFLSGISAGATIYAAASVSTIATTGLVPLASRLANALMSYAKYIQLMVWPQDLAFFYTHPVIWPTEQVIISLAVLVLITAVVLFKCRAYPYLLVGWLWYLGTLVPVIGIVQVGSQSLADRYAYHTLIGLFIMVAWGIPDLLRKFSLRHTVMAVGAGCILISCAWLTGRQAAYWQNSLSLFGRAVQLSPRNYLAHDLYGIALMGKGYFPEAIEHFSAAIRLKEDFGSPYNNLGLAMMKQGRIHDAIPFLSAAVRYSPDNAAVHFNLAEALFQAGRTDQAVLIYQKAAALRPDWSKLQNNLGIALERQGRHDEAVAAFQKAILQDPMHAGAHNNLAMIWMQKGRNEAAIAEFREAIRVRPDYAHAHFQLAEILERMGRMEEARFHAGEAARINPDYGSHR